MTGSKDEMNEGTGHVPDRIWLENTAREEVQDVLSNLPPEIKGHAEKIPVILEERPNESLIRDGVDRDTLGLFIGNAYPDEESSTGELPAQILLLMGNIWDYARHEAGLYRMEVRRTYLHEIGHYLGLDEDDMATRDLD